REMVEGVDPIAVETPDTLEEGRVGERAVRGRRVRERAVDEQQRPLGRARTSGRELPCGKCLARDVEPSLAKFFALPRCCLDMVQQVRKDEGRELIASLLCHLDDERPDRVRDEAACAAHASERGHLNHETGWRRRAARAALRLDGSMERQRTGWMANRQ